MGEAGLGLLVSIVFVAVLLAGAPIAFATAGAALLYLVLANGVAGLNSLGTIAWGTLDSFVLTTVPLFILMSDLLLQSGVGDRLYRGLSRVVVRLPGGLLQTNLVGCSLFAAISGSSLATAAAIGTVALPQLHKRGYDAALGTGTLAAGGTLGILIPPSLAFIIYGGFTDTSIAKLFIAGVVPGILLTLVFMAYAGLRALGNPALAPQEPPQPLGGHGWLMLVLDLLPVAAVFFAVLGGIFFGLFTPTEAAAVGVCLSLLVGVTLGDLTWQKSWAALSRTVALSAGVMLIVLAASLFSFAASMGGLPQALAAWIQELGLSRVGFIAVVVLLYLALGCVMESIGILVITIPLLYPLLKVYGIDPIWFGVAVVILIEIGMITPPFGMNLFVIQGIRGDGDLKEVIRGSMPFVFLMIAFVWLLVIFPGMATWLPSHMR